MARIANAKVQCREFAVLNGNPTDKVDNIVFANIEATSPKVTFTNKYPTVQFKNVALDGTPVK
jgi:hypothetical protein